MAAEAVQVQRRLIKVAEYEQMIQAGVFQEDDRLELIEGEILEMSPIGSAHMATVNRITQLMVQRGAGAAQVSVQNPIRLERSEPQPDICLLRPRADFYSDALPGPGDVLLLIEVADSTEEYDRGVKVPLYARSGIRETWLANLAEHTVEVYREPAPSGYRAKRTYGFGDDLGPELLPQMHVAVDEVFGAQ